MSKYSSKTISFIAIMAALGNVLSYISIQLAPIVPSIPFGPVTVSLAFDLSHLTTFISALFGGSIIGGLVGLIGGLVAAFEFGFSKGNLITGLGLPLGKAMTGLTAGFLFKKYFKEIKPLLIIIGTIISYIPEGIFTIIIFTVLYPIYFNMPNIIANTIATQIILKAIIEMILLGLLVATFNNNKSFVKYAKTYFSN
ncbi:ECF transporter S component [Candidatus Bathyarchaeota archaeon]|nr:ECF transporter S component [Candidatus Bathyarchaeota archaeon]